jgi:hypothetical protein
VQPSRLAQSGLSYESEPGTSAGSAARLRRHSGPAGGDWPDTADAASMDSPSASGSSSASPWTVASRPRRRRCLTMRATACSSTSPTSRVDSRGNSANATVEASRSRYTPSRNRMWRWGWSLRSELVLCTTTTAPLLPPGAPSFVRRPAENPSTVLTTMRVTAPSNSPSYASRLRHAKGTVSTHCRRGLGGSTHSTRFAAVDAIRLPRHDGQNPRPLHAKATRRRSWHPSHVT